MVESSQSTETRNRWVRWEWFNQFYEKQCHVWCLIVIFTFLVHLWLVICKSGPRSHYLCVLALTSPLVEYFASPTPNFCSIRTVRFLLRVYRRIWSRRQHAPNKRCALNNDVRLITWFYGITLLWMATCSLVTFAHKLYFKKNQALCALIVRIVMKS